MNIAKVEIVIERQIKPDWHQQVSTYYHQRHDIHCSQSLKYSNRFFPSKIKIAQTEFFITRMFLSEDSRHGTNTIVFHVI